MPLRHSYSKLLTWIKLPDVIPGRLEEANPESRDSGFDAAHRPGM